VYWDTILPKINLVTSAQDAKTKAPKWGSTKIKAVEPNEGYAKFIANHKMPSPTARNPREDFIQVRAAPRPRAR
jgi:hypothetical protein